MSSYDDHVINKIRSRARRLLRSLKTLAPHTIILNEARLVHEAAKDLGEGRWHGMDLARRAQDEAAGRKNIHGFCATPGCQEPLEDGLDLYGRLHCLAHYEEGVAGEEALKEGLENGFAEGTEKCCTCGGRYLPEEMAGNQCETCAAHQNRWD